MTHEYSRLIDTSAKLYDLNFLGFYNLEYVHKDDFDDVVKRAWEHGLQKIIVPAGSLFESVQAHSMALNDKRIHYTVGCHPRSYYKEYRDLIFKTTSYPQELADFYNQYRGQAVAYGDFGLDYERMYCTKEIQIEYFKEQLDIAEALKAPLYLSCQDAFEDFINILKQRNKLLGVIHSFKGTQSEADELLQLGLHIGINGNIFKSEETMEVLKKISNYRIIIGTQSPNYEVSLTYAGYRYVLSKFETVRRDQWREGKMVKFRNEPARLCQILEMLAGVKEMSVEDMENVIYNNTMNLFFRRR